MANLTVTIALGQTKNVAVLGLPTPNTGVNTVGYNFYPPAVVTCSAGSDGNHFIINAVGSGTTTITVSGKNANNEVLPNDTITVTVPASAPVATELGTEVN